MKYEAVQADGKTKKRPLALADITALEPFHWGYEFDEIIGTRGGFDAILTNPPWETFKPQAKEFFAEYSDIVTKNKMDIKAFEVEQERLLADPETQAAWLEYQSRFPTLSAYYRSAPQYKNQIAVVNGKKAGTDINLYKLFTEQCLQPDPFRWPHRNRDPVRHLYRFGHKTTAGDAVHADADTRLVRLRES